MTSPIERITVQCPACGVAYAASYRASYNAGLGEEWTAEEIEESSSATCPKCGHKVSFGQLRVSRDGRLWTFHNAGHGG